MNSIALFKRTEVIGRGKFGVVYKAFNKQTKQIVAIKVLNLDTQEDEVADVQQEIQCLSELKNVPNVTHYYGSILNDTKLWIIMDYCAGGSVRTLLKAGVFEEKYIAVIARELLTGLAAVHKLGVIHRDLKAANVLISKEGNVQLCDFGVAAKINSSSFKRTTMAGTPYWMAPEVIREGDSYNYKADIWSFGITLFEIATGNPPYCDKDAMWAMQMISKATPPRLEGREYSQNLKEAVALCLDENPEERPAADDLLKCKLIKQHRNLPTTILKETITRYLLWRDHHKARDSVFVSLEADIQPDTQEDTDIQVKWDFDSLSSREYIIDNDIDINQVEERYDSFRDYTYATERYATDPTLKADGNTMNNTHTGATNEKQSRQAVASGSTGIPKSLQSLFEEEFPELSSETDAYDLPQHGLGKGLDTKVDSPTIEIPDIDKMQNVSAISSGSTSVSSTQVLNKPPTLYHSQSAAAALESRFNTSNSSTTNRPRKKTISNSYSSSTGSIFSPTTPTPHTPAYTNAVTTKTPSPKPPSTAAFTSAGTGTNSPSKSMKALHSNTNPLLQPINFKANDMSTTSLGSSAVGSSTASLPSTVAPTKHKTRPGLHIQMPAPSSVNQLAALTNPSFESETSEPTNQFGVRPSQVGPMTMTPVTEKDSFIQNDEKQDEKPRERAESLSKTFVPPPRKLSGNQASALPFNKPVAVSSPSLNRAPKFPAIPSINGEFFLDTTAKAKLVSELDSIIKIFNAGLEALEERI